MYLISKRIFDLFFSFLLICIISPFLLLIIIAQIILNKAEVFYFQQRIGKNMKPFNIIKFATMLKDSPNLSGGLITTRKDKRVTKTGRILRITKLNELPQIFNVLFGQMSFVGPRPLVKSSIELYPPQASQTIYKSKPGITGIGSIVFRDEEKMVTESTLPPLEFYKQHIFPHKAQLELWYQQNASFLTDLKILFLTAWVILFPKSKLWKNWFRGLPERGGG